MNMFTLLAPFYDFFMSAMHKRQGNQLIELLAPWQGKKVLDVGGGTGKFAGRMQDAGADAWLLDASPQMLKRAQRILPWERCVLGDASHMPYDDRIFDCVTVVDAIHHIRLQSKTLAEVYRILAPGGILAILDFTPENHYVRSLARLERLAREPALFLTPHELEAMLTSCGFIKIKTKRLSAYEYLTTGTK